jgi:hypothetical protein
LPRRPLISASSKTPSSPSNRSARARQFRAFWRGERLYAKFKRSAAFFSTRFSTLETELNADGNFQGKSGFQTHRGQQRSAETLLRSK